MSSLPFPGFGHKRPQLDISIGRLHLDNANPRLPEEAQGKSEQEVLRVLYRSFALGELAESMAHNGYFDEEPLVAFPQELPTSLQQALSDSEAFLSFVREESTEFIVAEGNRRLATAKLLLDFGLRDSLHVTSWPSLIPEVEADIRVLPTIIYVSRSEVTPYLGVRHIIGIQKWDSYAKARYIAQMIEGGTSISMVQEQIGDRQGAVARNYACYCILEEAKSEFDFDDKRAKEDFSLLLLAVGQGNIKRFLGLPRKLADMNPQQPVSLENVQNLEDLLSWIFGDRKTKPVISESRDITNFLTHVVASTEALAYLRRTRDLIGAYERTNGEETLLIKYLSTANVKLENALGILHRHRTPEIIGEIQKCDNTIKAMLTIAKESNND